MRSLTQAGRHERRVQVIQLRQAGQNYDQIAAQTGLSRTGVFDICKRHAAFGAAGLHDAPGGRKPGEGRRLTHPQERLLQGLIVGHTPDALQMPELLWTRHAVGCLIEQRLRVRLPVRTLDGYLSRWGFTVEPPPSRQHRPLSVALQLWMAEVYPQVAAQARAQDGEINWAAVREVQGQAPTGTRADGPPREQLISSVTAAGRLCWRCFAGALDAPLLIDFLQRLTRDAHHRVFLLAGAQPDRSDAPVGQWLAEHEDDILWVDLPGAAAFKFPAAAP